MRSTSEVLTDHATSSVDQGLHAVVAYCSRDGLFITADGVVHGPEEFTEMQSFTDKLESNTETDDGSIVSGMDATQPRSPRAHTPESNFMAKIITWAMAVASLLAAGALA